jgi:hypothetical protein
MEWFRRKTSIAGIQIFKLDECNHSVGDGAALTAPRYLRPDPRVLAAETNQGRALHKPDAPLERRGSGASPQGEPLLMT